MINRLTALKDRPKADDMARHGLLMVGFGILALVCNAFFQIYMGRALGESEGEFNSLIGLLAVFTIVSALTQTVQTSVTKFTSKLNARNPRDSLGKINYLWWFSLRRTLLLGFGFFLIFLMFTPLASSFLNMGSNWSWIILSSTFILAFAVPTNQGILQGLQRFFPLGLCSAIPAIVKLCLGVLLVSLGLGVNGGLLAVSIATLTVFGISLLFINDVTKSGAQKSDLDGLFSYTGLALLAILFFAVLMNADVILAGVFLSKEDADTFSAVSVIGKVSLYVPMGIAIALFPKTSELLETGGGHILLLRRAMLYSLLLGGGVVIIYLFFSEPIASIYGGKYPLVAGFLFKYGLAMLFICFSFVSMNYLLSLNRTKVAYPLLAAVALQVGLVVIFHSNVGQIVNVMLVSGIASMLFMFPFYIKGEKCCRL